MSRRPDGSSVWSTVFDGCSAKLPHCHSSRRRCDRRGRAGISTVMGTGRPPLGCRSVPCRATRPRRPAVTGAAGRSGPSCQRRVEGQRSGSGRFARGTGTTGVSGPPCEAAASKVTEDPPPRRVSTTGSGRAPPSRSVNLPPGDGRDSRTGYRRRASCYRPVPQNEPAISPCCRFVLRRRTGNQPPGYLRNHFAESRNGCECCEYLTVRCTRSAPVGFTCRCHGQGRSRPGPSPPSARSPGQ